MNRRNFIKLAGLGAIAIATPGCGRYIVETVRDQLRKDYEFLFSLGKHIEVCEMRIGQRSAKGCGIVVDGMYRTMEHIGRVRVNQMFPIFENVDIYLKGVKAELIGMEKSNDTALYELPKYKTIPGGRVALHFEEFPLDRSDDYHLGQLVGCVGSPAMDGIRVMQGRITDLDGWSGKKGNVGTDMNYIGGDSAGAMVGLEDRVLLGQNSFNLADKQGYFIKQDEWEKLYRN